VFAWCVLFTPRYAMFAAIFVATTDLELAGTLAHDWAWLPTAPWDGVPSGNPPSAIAGGYSIIDGSVVFLLALLVRLGVAPGSGASNDESDRGEPSRAPMFPGDGGC
jgi:hypothetical protein